MNNKLPENYTSRQAVMDDLPEIHRLEEKKSLHYNGVPGFSLERLRNEYAVPGFDPNKSVHLVENLQGVLVGLVEVWDTLDPAVHPFVWITMDTDLENLGIEKYLLAWAEERARQVFSRVEPDLRIAVRANTNQVVESVVRVLKSAGFEQIRHGFRMRVEMDQEPETPVWPEGISLRPFNPELDARRVYETDEEVFQDHFGFIKEDPDVGFEKFMHHMTGDDSYDPSLWYLAVDENDEIVAICLCRRYGAEEKETGFVSSLGVKRPWRRQGIAQALLLEAFGEYFKRGMTKVDLGVDAESLTGATDLYKKVGMVVLRQFDLYEKVLRPGKDVSVNALVASEA